MSDVAGPNPRITQQNVLDYFAVREGSTTDHLIEEFMIYFQYETIESYLNCYKFNGGRNASNQQTEILQSNQFGALSGLILQLYLPKRDFIYYYIGDNKVCNIISWAQLMLKVSEGNMVVEIVY